MVEQRARIGIHIRHTVEIKCGKETGIVGGREGDHGGAGSDNGTGRVWKKTVGRKTLLRAGGRPGGSRGARWEVNGESWSVMGAGEGREALSG